MNAYKKNFFDIKKYEQIFIKDFGYFCVCLEKNLRFKSF